MSADDLLAAIALAEFKSINRVADSTLKDCLMAPKEHGTKKGDEDKETRTKKKTKSKREKRVKHIQFPVEPTVVQTVKAPTTQMNHSYRDFSLVRAAEKGDELPEQISDMSFPQKLHHILSQEEYAKYISWMPHGRAFKIHVPSSFERQVSLKYFGHARYSSFLRQLNNHGFKCITTGTDRNSYYHELLLRGLPHLSKYMPRPKQNAKRLIPDPENEPDFYKIAKTHPLPEKVVSVEKEKQVAAVDVVQEPAVVMDPPATSNVVQPEPTLVSQPQSQLTSQNILNEIAKAFIAQQPQQEATCDSSATSQATNLLWHTIPQTQTTTLDTTSSAVQSRSPLVTLAPAVCNQASSTNVLCPLPENKTMQSSQLTTLFPAQNATPSTFCVDHNTAVYPVAAGQVLQRNDLSTLPNMAVQIPDAASLLLQQQLSQLSAQQQSLQNTSPHVQQPTLDAYALTTSVLAAALLQQQLVQK